MPGRNEPDPDRVQHGPMVGQPVPDAEEPSVRALVNEIDAGYEIVRMLREDGRRDVLLALGITDEDYTDD